MNAITRIVNELAQLDVIVHNDDVSAKLHSKYFDMHLF